MQRLYILKVKLYDDNKFIYKIGKSSESRSTDRMLEVMRSFFMTNRYLPYLVLKRDRPVENAFELETKLHQHFSEYKYYFDKKFDGSNEFFAIPREDILLKAYDDILPAKARA